MLAFPVDRVFHAPLPEQRAEPPGLLLSPGADGRGRHASVLDAIRSVGLSNGESAGYRIMTDGAFISQEVTTGRAGVRYLYLELEAPDAPVEVITLRPPRPDRSFDRELRERITGPVPTARRRRFSPMGRRR